ncbi:MAG: hypothetical protein ACRCY7_07765 [Cetobacterium sp.]|uniref:hypothetical protein n=1 Tax=Cetobacterium sp. TaxID=2071632 RepID=UPI003F3B761A
MKKLILVLAMISLVACSSLKSMDAEHKQARKELRLEQKAKKKALGEEHKLEAKKLSKRLEIERKLLKTKQALELVEYGGSKYKELIALKEQLEELLK